MPGAVLGSFLTNTECLPAEMIFRVELIGVVVIVGIGEEVHSRPSVVELVPEHIMTRSNKPLSAHLWHRVNENNPCSHLSFDIVPLNSVHEASFA